MKGNINARHSEISYRMSWLGFYIGAIFITLLGISYIQVFIMKLASNEFLTAHASFIELP